MSTSTLICFIAVVATMCLISIFLFRLMILGITKFVRGIKSEIAKFVREIKQPNETNQYYKVTHNSVLDTYLNKGRLGEYAVYKALRHREYDGAKFLFNLYIPKKNGGTSEIDVIMIDQSGLFVFESKNYKGWIFGEREDKQWTQVLYNRNGGSDKYQFPNPIIQNARHIKFLKEFIGPYKLPIYSVVIFSNICEFKTNVDIDCDEITRFRNLNNKVNHFAKQTSKPLHERQIEWLYQKLYPHSQISREEKQLHIQQCNQNN